MNAARQIDDILVVNGANKFNAQRKSTIPATESNSKLQAGSVVGYRGGHRKLKDALTKGLQGAK